MAFLLFPLFQEKQTSLEDEDAQRGLRAAHVGFAPSTASLFMLKYFRILYQFNET